MSNTLIQSFRIYLEEFLNSIFAQKLETQFFLVEHKWITELRVYHDRIIYWTSGWSWTSFEVKPCEYVNHQHMYSETKYTTKNWIRVHGTSVRCMWKLMKSKKPTVDSIPTIQNMTAMSSWNRSEKETKHKHGHTHRQRASARYDRCVRVYLSFISFSHTLSFASVSTVKRSASPIKSLYTHFCSACLYVTMTKSMCIPLHVNIIPSRISK